MPGSIPQQHRGSIRRPALLNRIQKVAIIGAGTMGGGIAAHLANTGLPVLLLDIPTPNLSEAEQSSPKARNRFVEAAYTRMVKARPANLARPDRAELISLGNTEDDLGRIAEADWIIEVVVEQLAPKQALMARVDALRKPGSIVSSNTSGIPIHLIAEGRSRRFQAPLPRHALLQPAALSQAAGGHPHRRHRARGGGLHDRLRPRCARQGRGGLQGHAQLHRQPLLHHRRRLCHGSRAGRRLQRARDRRPHRPAHWPAQDRHLPPARSGGPRHHGPRQPQPVRRHSA